MLQGALTFEAGTAGQVQGQQLCPGAQRRCERCRGRAVWYHQWPAEARSDVHQTRVVADHQRAFTQEVDGFAEAGGTTEIVTVGTLRSFDVLDDGLGDSRIARRAEQ